ncbi:PBP1A family penicillin-binding protein [Sandarakinorhabdus sp.]|uniref:penicillin-binding protein 1A n=1 Tax=Sandarakinorhabdus sp. TaxID=1916663 RepID=UPI00286E743B|nr:PBP1A family penicillin-binding protein [Sandarakinorhabdus sp.]
MSRNRLLLLIGLPLLLAGFFYWQATKGLPSEAELASFTPALPSTVRDVNGEIVTAYTRERRIFVPYAELPPRLVQAYVSAEDKGFFEHDGIDWLGIVRAAFTNVGSLFSDKRPVGASTITQQVAKSLVGNEVSLWRKIREAILARRLEGALSKQQILEIYLNQIFLGRNAYGVEAAAQAYFGKSVEQLDLAQMAYLAILPKAPSTYDPVRRRDRALGRRDYVLTQMAANGHISAAERAAAAASPLDAIPNRALPRPRDDYFIEDVRRTLIGQFGEAQENGPNSVYGGGLWIRTSLDPVMQAAAEQAMRDGMTRYEAGRAWRGPVKQIDIGANDSAKDSGAWPGRLSGTQVALGYAQWVKAVVLAKQGNDSTIGFTDGRTETLYGRNAAGPYRATQRSAAQVLRPGDVIVVTRTGAGWALRQPPEVSGGMVVEEVATGRVRAMVGGFDARAQAFNRATQANRQPGSTFKPIVYATAMDNGFTPASIVVDGSYCVFQTRQLGTKCFRNFNNMRAAGPQTLRWGLEQSRNLMTVRIADATGMDRIVAQARALGIGEYQPVLSIALGAGETTVMKLTNAYAQIFNQGRKLQPGLIDYVQDRSGKIIWRRDNRGCPRCNAPAWNGEAMPRPQGRIEQAMDARTAYQILHLMEGVIQRGTGTALLPLNRPLAGKTGTTNGPRDVWFVGGTQDIVAGLYLGYDQPRGMGGYAQGGTLAAPIWRQWGQVALKDWPTLPFAIPAGVRMVRIDRRSGKRVFGVWPDPGYKPAVIWEAFKPDSEPRRINRARDVFDRRSAGPIRSDAEFLESEGGIY